MYIETVSTKRAGKVYTCILLRESFREDGKVKHRTIANLTNRPNDEIEAIRFALQHKGQLPDEALTLDKTEPSCEQGLSVGAIIVLSEVAKRLGITQSLGGSREAKLALWQVIARVIQHGSRLGAVRLAETHAACDILSLTGFIEDDLYRNLDWLSSRQMTIENHLFKLKQSHLPCHLFLYDVTSSYLEGECNEYGEFGYNRDKKKGKKQIVIGLLTDHEGDPVSVQVFHGNTSDNTTVLEQIQKIVVRFGVKRSIFVGDRGMLKGPQLKAIGDQADHITALTTPQMRTLINKQIFTLEMFQNKAHTVHHEELRYILRRNPIRQQEIAENRNGKKKAIDAMVNEKNTILAKSSRTNEIAALKVVNAEIKKLGLDKWLKVQSLGRKLILEVDSNGLEAASQLDGCYVIKTNVKESPETSSKIIHDRYKDLALVEWAFRTWKADFLEIRPHYVRKTTRTEGHVFVVMLAYKIIRHLAQCWKDIGVTIEEGVAELDSICLNTIATRGKSSFRVIPKPRLLGRRLLEALDVQLPDIVPDYGVAVSPRKKLVRHPSKRHMTIRNEFEVVSIKKS
jgi:transposase